VAHWRVIHVAFDYLAFLAAVLAANLAVTTTARE